jgi:hypothetical protein
VPEDRQRLEYERKKTQGFLNLSVDIPTLEVVGNTSHELSSESAINNSVVIAMTQEHHMTNTNKIA